jgi:2,4-dienoyl-CoA reductase-like NADH-dependent reductase (Old Yellow Enzyme family)
MADIFDETVINGMILKNRLVRSATWEGMCEEDGRPTEKLIELYGQLADGGVGLIVTGYTFVRPEGKQLPGKMGLHTDDFAEEMKKMTRIVHEKRGKICIQLVHAGGQTDSANAGRQPLAPSGIKVEQFPETPKEMTQDDINQVVEAFGKGARRAKGYGFDAVQLHGAHGYLINQFLSPLTNKRTDQYGGSIENRCRFMLEAYNAIRRNCGICYPVLIKLNGSDFLDGGLELEDAVYAAKLLDDAGIDAIEVSGGTPASGEKSPVRANILKPEQEAYNLELAAEIRQVVRCPVIAVGGFRRRETIEKAFNSGAADYISLARPFIREPDLVKRWEAGDREPASCISCNGCFKPGLEEGGIYCVVEKKLAEDSPFAP